MSRVKAGDVLSCEVCGLVVIVDEECGCAVAEIICCEEPMMNKGPAARKKEPAAAGLLLERTGTAGFQINKIAILCTPDIFPALFFGRC